MRKFDEKKFLRIYKGNDKFITEGKAYYDAFLELLQNKPLLKHIKFANDVLGVPPLQSFVRYNRLILKNDLFNDKMTHLEKQGLGSCFSYLYKKMYNEKYEPVPCWINDEETGIRTGSKYVKKD